ncbi:MAG: NAD(P)-dependent oxidoreductase, partial [Phycisphaeraceae bacterium]|nr:NAD(P)-dependent oxidoreductase [Phycisphaeraceae bacterium]
VLVTGSAGAVGQPVCAELMNRGHVVRGFDLKVNPTVRDSQVGSIVDLEAVRRAMVGMEAVVHLAAQPDIGDFATAIMPNNYLGLYHVLEAAREAKLRRVVLASSVQTANALHRKEGMIRLEDGVGPTNHYALSKVVAEEMGRMYARLHGMSVLAVRLGWMPRDRASTEHVGSGGGRNLYISPGDAGRCFVCCVEAGLDGKPGTAGELIGREGGRYGVLFAIGQPVDRTVFDPEPAKVLAAFEPQDQFPQGAPE